MANGFTFIWNCCTCPSVQEQHCALTIICCALMVKFWGKSSTWAIKAQLIPAVLMGQAIHWWQLRKEWYQKYELTCSNVMPTVLIRSGCFVSLDWQEIYFLINVLQWNIFFCKPLLWVAFYWSHILLFGNNLRVDIFFSINHIVIQTELVLGTYTLCSSTIHMQSNSYILSALVHLHWPTSQWTNQSIRSIRSFDQCIRRQIINHLIK